MGTINKKLKTKDILGYTIGSIGDSTSYNFILSFLSCIIYTPGLAGSFFSSFSMSNINLDLRKIFK